MGFLWISAVKDVRRRLADRTSLLLWLGIPLLIGGLMSLAIGGGGGPSPRAKVLVADQDDSFLSNALLSMAGGAGVEDGLLDVAEVELDAGEARMAAGEASGLLVIPEGFGEALFRSRPSELRLVTNPSQRILPGILEQGLEMLVEVVFYLQQLLGPELETWAEGPGSGASFFADASIAAQSAAINAKMRGLENVLFPPVLEVVSEVVEEDDGVPEGGIGLLLFPGIVFMALLFVAQGMSDDLWTEVDAGTLRRSLAAPHGLGAVLLGKLLAGALVIGALCAVATTIGAVLFEVSAARLLPAWAWASLAGTALYPLFLFVQTLGQTKRAAGILANVLVFPLMMLGGSFFPFEAMPAWMASLGRRTPNGLAVTRLKQLLGGELDLAGVAVDAGLLVVAGALLFLLTCWRARRRFLSA